MSCPDCFKGAVHDHAEPKGQIETLYGVPTYISPAPASSTSKSTIFFICDAFGLNLVNNKLLCDRYAADTGCRVLAPDVIPGSKLSTDVFPLMDQLQTPVAWLDLAGQFWRAVALFGAMYHFVPFMWHAYPTTGAEPCLKFARAVKKDLPPSGKLGIAGFCWGGYSSTYLCKEPAVEGGSEPLINAQFCAHPSGISKEMVLEALSTFKVPYSMAIGDQDFVFDHKTVLATEAAAREKIGVAEDHDYEIVVFKGCKHGFAVRAMPGDKVEMDAAEVAAQQAANWYKKYLH